MKLRRYAIAAVALGALLLAPIVPLSPAVAADDPPLYGEHRWDFDTDGYLDTVLAAPGEQLQGTTDTGGVTVLYGGPDGPRTNRSQWISPQTQGFARSGAGIREFGVATTAGDFDGDGYGDLAVTAKTNIHGSAWSGEVHIFYGSPTGLTMDDNAVVRPGHDGVPALPGARPSFGASLVSGGWGSNIDLGTLAVGAPTAGTTGAVVLIPFAGAPRRESAMPARTIVPGGPDFPFTDTRAPASGFGSQLALGSLLVGDLMIMGRSPLVTAVSVDYLDYSLHAAPLLTDKFALSSPLVRPLSVATLFWNNDSKPDLAIGVLEEDGYHVLILRSAYYNTPSSRDRLDLRARSPQLAGPTDPDASFGCSLAWAPAPTLSSHAISLLIGSCSDTVGSQRGAGSMTVISPDVNGNMRLANSTLVTQQSAGIPGSANRNAAFGASVRFTADAGGVGFLIGVPGQQVGRAAAAGAIVSLHYGEDERTSIRLLTQDSTGVFGAAEPGDRARLG